MDKRGKTHIGEQTTEVDVQKKIRLTKTVFSDLKLSKIAEFRLQIRPCGCNTPHHVPTQPTTLPAANANKSPAYIWKKYPALKEKQDETLAAMRLYLKSLKPEAFADKHHEIVRLSASRNTVERIRARNAIAALRDLAGMTNRNNAVLGGAGWQR